jgi:hypothetical protein
MTPAELHNLIELVLDDECDNCEYPFRWCECVRARSSGMHAVSQPEMLDYLVSWLDAVGDTPESGHFWTAVRLYASWLRAQAVRR